MSALAKIYGKHVLSGKKSLDEVPETIREEVKEYVLSVDPHFFDVSEDTVEETPVEDTDKMPQKNAPISTSGGSEENPTEGNYTPVDTSENAE